MKTKTTTAKDKFHPAAADYNFRNEMDSIAPLLTADRLHQIIQSAMAGDTRELFLLYRDMMSDPHLQSQINLRKLAVLGQKISIQPWDKATPIEQSGVNEVWQMISRCRSWTTALSHLMDGVLWPVAVVEKEFIPTASGYALGRLVPVPAQLLDYSTGVLRIRDVDAGSGLALPTSHDPDPARYIVHRGHLLTQADQWGGPMRALLWWWLFSTQNVAWWVRFLDKFGAPFVVAKYDGTNDKDRIVLRNAMQAAVRIGGLVVTKETEVELQQALASSADAYEKFLNIADRQKSKLILGQTLSSEAQPTGLGSGAAGVQENVRMDIRLFDAMTLAATLRDQLFAQILQINGLTIEPPTISFGGVSSGDKKAMADLLGALKTAGFELEDDDIAVLSDTVGFRLKKSAAPLAPAPFQFSAPIPLSVRADSIPRSRAAELAQAFRGSLAPIRQIIEESTSAADCEQRIRLFYADHSPEKIVPIIEEALSIMASKGGV